MILRVAAELVAAIALPVGARAAELIISIDGGDPVGPVADGET